MPLCNELRTIGRMFALTAIEHRYDAAPVLRVEAWAAAAGDHWLLSGPSGSGKTTLLHILAGLTVPTAGAVSVAGVDLATLSGSALRPLARAHVGLVPQRLHLVGALDVLGNLALARYLAGLPADAARARELLDAMGDRRARRTLSAAAVAGPGAAGRVARAVINRPALLLADEPTANLDDAHAQAALDAAARAGASRRRDAGRRLARRPRARAAAGGVRVAVAAHGAAHEPRRPRLRLCAAAAAVDAAQRAAAGRRASRRSRWCSSSPSNSRPGCSARPQGIDLVVGAKGSPLQIVLAGVYHADVPPGTSRWPRSSELARAIRWSPEVIPLALGDSFRGYRIVGTEPSLRRALRRDAALPARCGTRRWRRCWAAKSRARPGLARRQRVRRLARPGRGRRRPRRGALPCRRHPGPDRGRRSTAWC